MAQYLIDHHGFKKLGLEVSAEPNRNGTGTSTPSAFPETRSAAGDANPESTTTITVARASPFPGPAPAHLRHAAPTHVFATAQELLDYVTRHWRSRWVTTDVHDEEVLDLLSRRPFFLLISVDAPVTVRWERWRVKSGSSGSLEDFVTRSDAQLYAAAGGLLPVISRASVRLLNTSADLAHLYATLGKLDLVDGERLRPGWDSYFMTLASLAARRCNCMKRAVGCVLVDGVHRVVSTGYNGTPRALRNCGDGGCARCNAGDPASSGAALATCLCLHAEENALLEAGRERIRPGSILYCNTCPCLTCSIKIVQVGISEVVYSQSYSMDGATAEVFRAAGVKLRQFSPVSRKKKRRSYPPPSPFSSFPSSEYISVTP